MIKRELPPHPQSRGDSGEGAHELLVTLNRYAAIFDLMLSAWRDRSIYETVKEELALVAAGQKEFFPEAGVAMMGLTIAHSDVAAVLLDMAIAQDLRKTSRFTQEDVAARQQRHAEAVEEMRSYILRKTH